VRRSRQESGIRERIAEVATRLFCEKGFGQTTVSEIVARAGVTKPVLYYYFGSKAGLFNALFADHFQGIQAIVDRAAALEGPIRDKLLRLTLDQFAFCEARLDCLRFVLHALFGPQKGTPRDRYAELQHMTTGLVSQILRLAVEQGELRPLNVEHLGVIFIGMVHMFIMRHLFDPSFALDASTAEQLVDVFLYGAHKGANDASYDTVSAASDRA